MLPGFLQEYFINPVLYGGGYNWVNTFVYAVLLIALSILVVFPALRKLGVKMDGNLGLAVCPYILLGSIFSSLRDIEYFTSWMFKTPALYLLVFSIFFLAVLASKLLEKKTKVPYEAHLFSIGFVLSGLFFTQLRFQNYLGFAQVLIPALIVFAVIFSPIWKASLWNKSAVFAQSFDAIATVTALEFYSLFYEQHVATNLLLGLTGSYWAFLLIKPLLAFLLVWAVDREIDNKSLANFIKLIAIVLGFGQGFRNMLMIVGFG
jgi:uncharacterized membrane protein